MDSVRDAGASNTLPVDFEEMRARQDVRKVGRVGVVISLTMLWYWCVMRYILDNVMMHNLLDAAGSGFYKNVSLYQNCRKFTYC